MQNKEVLNNKKIQELFGNNYTGVVVYDFDTKSYNKTSYHGQILMRDKENTVKPCYHIFEKQINRDPRFANKYEVVGFAAMTVNYPDQTQNNNNQAIINPQYNQFGLQVAGTIIVRDLATGKIQPIPNQWLLLMDGRNLVTGKSYIDGAQKNLDAIITNHGKYATTTKSTKLIEQFTRKRDTAIKIANCINRRELASTIYWQMPLRCTNAFYPALRDNVVNLYMQKQK